MRAKYIKVNRNKQQSPKTQKKKETNKQKKTNKQTKPKKKSKKKYLKKHLTDKPYKRAETLKNTKQ